MKNVMQTLKSSFRLLAVMTVLLGGIYPLAVTVVAQLLFSEKANGSVIVREGKVMGSALLGQEFQSKKYFWGRLSATTPAYNPSVSSGSNLSPHNPKLLEAINARVDALHKADPTNHQQIPEDLVTASASGLDPHVSLAAIQYQLPRVAKARGRKPEAIQPLIDQYTQSGGFGLIDAPYVNVLQLNLALDEK